MPFDDWPWGHCRPCGRDVVTVPERLTPLDDTGPVVTRQVLSWHTTQRMAGQRCAGSGLPPSAPRPELTAAQEAALVPIDTVDYSAEAM
ncbi:hypothetical protein ACGFZA_15910 [Streptomyces sp. NPDC048211]|uniref:hypothetical protein n=1 Tax=Streptomyces sp. NPDC048211 TaxID=3365516 RepID=UPI003720E071